jgi:hypothetical protein
MQMQDALHCTATLRRNIPSRDDNEHECFSRCVSFCMLDPVAADFLINLTRKGG